MEGRLPRVVIVGGGFGGLAAAKALRRSPVTVVLIDRSNHHVFQPLLYQVATSVLAAGQIASPIRSLLADHTNAFVMLGTVTEVDKVTRQVIVDTGGRASVKVAYDYLVIATGATHSYFGHNEFAPFAPGLKSLADAESIRNHILKVFECAEVEEDAERRKALMTFLLVGAGPTGVEMASAIAVMAKTTLRRDFRRIDPRSAHVILVDMGKRPLGAFSEKLSEAAKRRLLKLGVDLRLELPVETIDEDGAVVGGKRIASKTVIWTAGVAPSPAGKWLNCEVDRSGRVRIQPNLTVQDHPEIFVVGTQLLLSRTVTRCPGSRKLPYNKGDMPRTLSPEA